MMSTLLGLGVSESTGSLPPSSALRIGVVLDGERRAAGEADAGVIARAGVFIDAVLHAYIALALGELLGDLRFEAPLPLELALAFGDDHFEPGVVSFHRLLVDLGDFADLVVVHRAQPLHAQPGKRV